MYKKIKNFVLCISLCLAVITSLLPVNLLSVNAAASPEPVLTGSTDRDNGIRLVWTAGNRVQGENKATYTILRKRDDGYYSGLVNRDPKYGLFYLDASNLTVGKEYTYKVRETINGESFDSNEVTVKVVANGKAENEFSDKKSAANYLKDQMVNRNKKITIIYNASAFPTGLAAELYDIAREDKESADSKTAKEGDYLRYTIVPGSNKISSGIDGKVGELTSYTFTFTLDYYTSKSDETAVDNKVSEILAQFAKDGVTASSSEFDKAKAVYDYLSTNVHYNREPREDNGNLMITAYDSLVRKEAQCYGQTLGAYRLLKELGLVTRRVNGKMRLNGELINHGWNIVKINGKWYNFDATASAAYYEETNDVTYKMLLRTYSDFVNQEYTLNTEYTPSSEFGKAHPYGTTVYPSEPDAPATLTLRNLGSGKIEASCSKVSGATGYALYRSTASDGTFEKVAEGTTTTLVDNTAKAGTQYHYKMKSSAIVNGTKMYSRYSPRRIITAKNTGTPVFTSVVANSGSVTLKWSALAGADYYQVYRSETENGTYSLLNKRNVTTNSVVDSTVSAGKTYYYKVRAYQNNEYGMFSEIVKGASKPVKVSGLKAQSAGSTSVKLSWNKSEGAKYYQVYRSTNANTGFKKLGTYNESTLTAVSKSLATNQTYYYKVRSYAVVDGVAIYSDYSDVVKAVPKLSAPTNVKASANTSTTLKISWNLTDGGSYYQVYRSTSKDGKYSLLGVYDSKTTSSISRSLATGKTYYYKVRAYRWVNGERVFSPFSTVISGKPVLQKTSKVTAVPSSSTTAKISWNKIEGATYYQVYRGTSATGSYALLGTYDSNTTSSTSRSLKKGSTYYYKVRAYKWVNGERVFSPFSTPVKMVMK